MDRKRVCSALLLIVAVMVVFCLVAGPAFAQKVGKSDSLGGDKSLSMKRGLSVLDADKDKKDNGRSPSKLQMMMGFGSIVVMIVVVKWL